MKTKKSKRLLSLFLAVLMLLTAFPFVGLTASADMPTTNLFQFTQFRNNASNTSVGDRTDTYIPLVADSSSGAFSYAIAGFNIDNIDASAALASATLSGTLDTYSSSNPIDMKIEFHLVPHDNLWQSFAGIDDAGWKVTTSGSKGTLESGQDNYSYICGQLGLSADTLIGSVSHGATSYSFRMGEKLLAARAAGDAQIKVIAIYSSVNSDSASSACRMNHPSLKVNTAAAVFNTTHKYALCNHEYNQENNVRYERDGNKRIDIVSDTNGGVYSYGVWEYDLSSIDTDAVKIDLAELRSDAVKGVQGTVAGLHVDYYLVPADKMTNQYAAPSSTTDGQYQVTLNDATNGYNPTDTIKSELGLNDSNLIGTFDHQGDVARNLQLPFASKLSAALAAGQTTIKIIGLHRNVNTDNGVWSDMQVNHPTVFVNVSPKTSQIETVSETLQVTDWGVVNSQADTNRYDEGKEAVNIVSEAKTNPASNVFSMGWWSFDIPDSLKTASIDSAPLKVSVLDEANFGYATSSLPDMAVDFYVLNYSQYGNDAWFTQSSRQVTDVALQNGAAAALAHVKNKFNPGDSVATLVHGRMSNTYRLHNAVREAVRRGDENLLIIAVQQTPNTYNGTANWSDTWLKFPSLTVYSAQRAYSTTIDRYNDEDAVTGRITVNNAIYTHNKDDVYQYGHQIATTDNTDYETTFTVNEGTVKEIKCVEDGDKLTADGKPLLKYSVKSGNEYVLSGRLEDTKFSCNPKSVEGGNNITATLKFTFDDGAVEYHRVAVKSIPVPGHIAIRTWKLGGYQSGWVTVARGSEGEGAAGTWKYLDKWKPDTENYGGSAGLAENWLSPDNGYPNAGNYADGEHDQTAAKVTATYYFDKSNHNLGSGRYFDSATSDSYSIPIQLHTTYFSGDTFPRDRGDLDVNTWPSKGSYSKDGLKGYNTNGMIDGTVTIKHNGSIAASDISTDSNNDRSANLRIATRSANNSFGSFYAVYKFDVVVNYFDKSVVKAAYEASLVDASGNKYNENDYTATSFANYINALLEVEAWLTNYHDTTVNDTVNNELKNKLAAAEAGLKKRADLTELDKAYRQADLAIRTISNRDPVYTQSSVNQIITDAQDTSTREYINSTYDQRRDYEADVHQTDIDNKATTLTIDVSALNALDTSAYEAAISDSLKIDKDIYSIDSYNQAVNEYNAGITTLTYTDRNGTEYTVKALVDENQDLLNERVARILTYMNAALKSYSVTVPADVTTDCDLSQPVPYGKKVTLTSNNADTAWYMQYDSNDTSRGEQYQARGETYSFVVYGNMTITTAQRAENEVKITVQRKYSASNTNLPIVDVKYAAEGTTIDLNQFTQNIPCYRFTNFTDASGNVIDSNYIVGNKNAIINVNYTYDASSGVNCAIVATDVDGNEIYNQTGVPYNTKITLKGGSGTYAWVERIQLNTNVTEWRPFYIGENVTFFVSETTTLKAVTKADYDSMFNGVTAATNLRQNGALAGGEDANGKKQVFNGQFVLPEGATPLEWGILLDRFTESTDMNVLNNDLILENITDANVNGIPRYVRAKASTKTSANQYSIRISKLQVNQAFAYRSYLIYQYTDNGETVTKTIYSDASNSTIHGF